MDAFVAGSPTVVAGEDLEQGDLVRVDEHGRAYRAQPGTGIVARHDARSGEPVVVLRCPKFPVVPVDGSGNNLN